MCLVKYFTVTFMGRSPVTIKTPIPASQARFPQLRVSERFCLAGNNRHNDRRALSQKTYKFYIERTWRAHISQFSALRKLINSSDFPNS